MSYFFTKKKKRKKKKKKKKELANHFGKKIEGIHEIGSVSSFFTDVIHNIF